MGRRYFFLRLSIAALLVAGALPLSIGLLVAGRALFGAEGTTGYQLLAGMGAVVIGILMMAIGQLFALLIDIADDVRALRSSESPSESGEADYQQVPARLTGPTL